jgi:ribosome-associated protein
MHEANVRGHPPREAGGTRLEANDLARLIVQIAEDKKAEDILMLDIRGLSVIADYFVICTGTSERQVRAIARDLDEQLGKQGITPIHIEGLSDARWVLMDYNTVIVHIFDPITRDYYRLDKLWADAPRVLVIQ